MHLSTERSFPDCSREYAITNYLVIGGTIVVQRYNQINIAYTNVVAAICFRMC